MPARRDGGLHAAQRAVAILGRRRDVISVAGETVADHLGVDLRTTALGVLERLEHHDAGALAHHKAVAILVVGARGALRRVVEAGRQRAAGNEARHADARDRRFRAARHHHVGVAERDQPRGVADGMRPGRAGGHHRMVRPLQPMRDRHIAGGEIDQPAGNEERRHPARPALLQHDGGFRDSGEAADAGADHHAGVDLVLIARGLPTGIGQRLRRRAHRKDDEVVDLALLLRLHPLVGIEAAVAAVAARNLAGDLGRRGRRPRTSRSGARRSCLRAAAATWRRRRMPAASPCQAL